GPNHWKELKATCGGDKQSPVNIDRRWLQRDGGLGDILFEGYDQAPPGKWRLTNDGHTAARRSPHGIKRAFWREVSSASSYSRLAGEIHGGSARGGCPHLAPPCFPQLHIVHINVKYRTLAEAKGHPNGLAVLGFFLQASETPNTNYNTIVAGLRNVSHAGDSVDLASTFRLGTLLPRASRLSGYYRYQGSITTPDCSEAVVEEPVEIGREQVL
ncbi:Carbonic anhydrase 15, partial [Eurypyga helias]